jgi:ribonuclease BN (tRNA processing enzyme)
MDAVIDYRTLEIGVPHAVGDVVVHNVLMNHPVTNLGYRVECNGRAVFFTGDHEPFFNPHVPGSADHAAAQREIERRERDIERALEDVDALVADCSYTLEEYPSKQGWGHGTFDAAIALALKAGVRSLYCTHHEPTRSDEQLDAVFAEALARWHSRLGGLSVTLAYEGLEVTL